MYSCDFILYDVTIRLIKFYDINPIQTGGGGEGV